MKINTVQKNFRFLKTIFLATLWLTIAINNATYGQTTLFDSSSKGVLPQTMTTAQRNAIVKPESGLVIYNTDTKSLETYNGNSWSDQTNDKKSKPSSTSKINGSGGGVKFNHLIAYTTSTGPLLVSGIENPMKFNGAPLNYVEKFLPDSPSSNSGTVSTYGWVSEATYKGYVITQSEEPVPAGSFIKSFSDLFFNQDNYPSASKLDLWNSTTQKVPDPPSYHTRVLVDGANIRVYDNQNTSKIYGEYVSGGCCKILSGRNPDNGAIVNYCAQRCSKYIGPSDNSPYKDENGLPYGFPGLSMVWTEPFDKPNFTKVFSELTDKTAIGDKNLITKGIKPGHLYLIKGIYTYGGLNSYSSETTTISKPSKPKLVSLGSPPSPPELKNIERIDEEIQRNDGAIVSNNRYVVHFDSPKYDGGFPITKYSVTVNDKDIDATGTSSPIAIYFSDLNRIEQKDEIDDKIEKGEKRKFKGKELKIKVIAENLVGKSEPSNALTIDNFCLKPNIPKITKASPSCLGSMTVSYESKGDNGCPITEYTLTIKTLEGGIYGTYIKNINSILNNTPDFEITGDVPKTGKLYISASNGEGNSGNSAAFEYDIDLNNAPKVEAVAETSLGGGVIVNLKESSLKCQALKNLINQFVLHYEITALPDGGTAWVDELPYTMNGLTLGKSYTFTIEIMDGFDPVVKTPESNSVIPIILVEKPSEPTYITLHDNGVKSVKIGFTPPTSKGTITAYNVRQICTSGGIDSTKDEITAAKIETSTLRFADVPSSPITLDGLDASKNYFFWIQAENSMGKSEWVPCNEKDKPYKPLPEVKSPKL